MATWSSRRALRLTPAVTSRTKRLACPRRCPARSWKPPPSTFNYIWGTALPDHARRDGDQPAVALLQPVLALLGATAADCKRGTFSAYGSNSDVDACR